jgi:hypothetical protein
MNPTTKEAAQRLDGICNELRNYNVQPEDIEALRQLSVRFQFHFCKLESFRKRLTRWTEGCSC